MADYKPVHDLPDDAVEMVAEGSNSPVAFVDSSKNEIQEDDHASTPHRASATPSSSVINLANTVLGSGMLAMVKQYKFVVAEHMQLGKMHTGLCNIVHKNTKQPSLAIGGSFCRINTGNILNYVCGNHLIAWFILSFKMCCPN
jgi:hypothetical protein